jgi:hypothetical protein
MTTKEKAKELFYKMSDVFQGNLDNYTAERCALIAVDEIINNNSKIPGDLDGLHIMENILFWEEVKHEINNL